MSAAPTRVRLGPAIEAQLAAAGPNLSAAMRAYLLLGFAAAGVDMAPLRREVARAAAEELPAGVLAALGRLGLGGPPLGRESISTPIRDEIDDSDPLMSVGFAV